MIPVNILQGDCDCVLMDWGVNAVAEVVTVSGEPPEETVTETTVMVIISAVRRIPVDGASDLIEMTLTVPMTSAPTVPEGSTLRWRYDGHQWDLRHCRTPPGETVCIYDVRRAD